MDGAPDVALRRNKVRCPKCTAVLREPDNGIYKCRICSTLLLETSDNSGLKLKENSNISNSNRAGFEGIRSRIAMPEFYEQYQYDTDQRIGYTYSNESGEASRLEENLHMLRKKDPNQKRNPLFLEKSHYSLNERQISRSGESSFKDDEEDRFSELSSASNESEFEEGSTSENIDEVKVIKDMYANTSVSNHSTSMNISNNHSVSKQPTVESFENLKEDPKEMAGNATDKGSMKYPSRRLFDLRVFGILNEKAYEELNSVKHVRSSTSESTEQVYQDHQKSSMDNIKALGTEETSNSSSSMQDVKSPQQDANDNGEISEETDLNDSFLGNARVELTAHTLPSINAASAIDSDALVEARYGNVVSGKDLSPEVLSYVDVSFGDWKSPHEVPEFRNTVDEKRMVTSEGNDDADEWEDVDSADTLKKYSMGNSVLFQGQGEQNTRSLTKKDGVLPERAVLPFRTAAMQKFLLQRTEQESITNDKADQETSTYEAPYDFNYVPRQAAKHEEATDKAASTLTIDAHINEQSPSENRMKGENLLVVQGLGTHIQKESLMEMSPSNRNSVKDLRGVHSIAFENAHTVEKFGSNGSKYLDTPVDKMDQLEIEKMNLEQRKVVNASFHPMPSDDTELNRRSPLKWKGKSKAESRNDNEGHGLELMPNRNMGKTVIVKHGTEITEGHSHFDKDSKPGSAQWSRRWNRSFDGDLHSIQQENAVRGDQSFPIVDSFNRNNSHSVSSQEVEFRSHLVEQYHKNPYGLPVGSNLPHQLPLLSFSTMSSIPPHEKTFSHSMSPYNRTQYQVQQSQRYQNMILHQGVGHQSLHHQEHDHVSELSSSSSYRESRNPPPRSRRQNRSKLHQKYLATKERSKKLYPPLPDKMAAPYVLCKYCKEILEIPSYLPPCMGPIQKLQCGACKKLCKFSICLQGSNHSERMNPSSLNNCGVAVHGYEQEEQSADSESEHSFRQRSLLEQNSLYYFSRNGSSVQPQRKGTKHYIPSKPNDKDFNSDIVDNMYHPRTMAITKIGNSRVYNDGYLSSSPSSASGSSPGKYHMTRGDFGEKTQPQNLIVESKMYDEDRHDAEVTFSPDDFYWRNSGTARNVVSHNPRPQVQAEFSRNSLRNMKNAQFFPGSPQVVIIPEVETTSSYQEHMLQDSLENDPRSPPWSPAQGSYHNEHLAQDNDRESQSPSPRGASKETKSYARFLRKSFMDFGKGHKITNRGKGVTINGHVILDAAVRKAEEKAGTVHPGTYWYDYRAGFWGVIGSPCQGIVMPHIEEFKFPMEKGCSGGNTEILVNGRELHKKDLDVLAKRGLPTLRGRAYVVDIQGNITDMASGQPLKSLGKLAPSIEKKGRGWGMFQPAGGTLQQ